MNYIEIKKDILENKKTIKKIEELNSCLREKKINISTDFLLTLVLMSPLISVATADGEVSFFEKIELSRIFKDINIEKQKSELPLSLVIENYQPLEMEFLSVFSEILKTSSDDQKLKIIEEMTFIAGIDGKTATVANFSIMLACSILGFGLGYKIYKEEMGPSSFSGSCSKHEIKKIFDICKYLGLPTDNIELAAQEDEQNSFENLLYANTYPEF